MISLGDQWLCIMHGWLGDWAGSLLQQLFLTLTGLSLLCFLRSFCNWNFTAKTRLPPAMICAKIEEWFNVAPTASDLQCTYCISTHYSVVNLSHAVHLKIAKKEKRRPSILQSCKLILLLPVLAPPSCRRSASRSSYTRSAEWRMTQKQKGAPISGADFSMWCPV